MAGSKIQKAPESPQRETQELFHLLKADERNRTSRGGNIAGRCSKSEINRSRNRKNNHKAYELTLNILFSESTQPVCTLQLKYRTSFRT